MSEIPCKLCDDTGWICEQHPTMPMDHDNGSCAGPGEPCPFCNRIADKAKRQKEISKAGFTPTNHPEWATAHWLLNSKASANAAFRASLDQFR